MFYRYDANIEEERLRESKEVHCRVARKEQQQGKVRSIHPPPTPLPFIHSRERRHQCMEEEEGQRSKHGEKHWRREEKKSPQRRKSEVTTDSIRKIRRWQSYRRKVGLRGRWRKRGRGGTGAGCQLQGTDGESPRGL